MTRNSRPIPEALVPLQQQFQQFRATHPPRSKLPEEFWAAAAGLAKQHGPYTVAHALQLDYVGLKKRVAGSVRRRRKPARPGFVELIAPGSLKLMSASLSSSPGAPRCVSIGRLLRRRTGRACCVHGARWRNDPDYRADAGSGRDRAG
jgi:hypothetical protein